MNPEDNDEGLIKHLIEEFRNYTLIDILRMIVNPDDEELKDKEGKIPIKKSYPRSKLLAIGLFGVVLSKFAQCSEKEKRSITRSDGEFIYMMKNRVLQITGFSDEHGNVTEETQRDVFGEFYDTIADDKLEIPRKERGKELLWAEIGDPEPEPLREDQARRVNAVLRVVFEVLTDKFPVEYETTFGYNGKNFKGRIMMNSSNRQAAKMLESKGKEFVRQSVPYLTNAIIEFVVNENKLDRDKYKQMYNEVVDSVWRRTNRPKFYGDL